MSKIEQIQKMNLFELRDEAVKVGVDFSGLKKQEIVNALVDYYTNNPVADIELGIIEDNLEINNTEDTPGLNCTEDKMELCSLDDMLPNDDTEVNSDVELVSDIDVAMKSGQVKELDIDLLDNSPLNFFSKLSDSKFNELKSSIADLGVLNPILVRPNNGRFDILAGRNRVDACKDLGLLKVPSIIKNVNDDDAEEIISDTNVAQRDDLKPLEIAKAYEIKARQIGKRQGQKSESGEKFNYLEKVGEEFKVSGVTVSRYLRLNNLIPEFKEKLDNEEIAPNTGFELGLVDEKTQRNLLDIIEKSSEPAELLKSKAAKVVKKAFNDKNKDNKTNVQPLNKTEIKELFNVVEQERKVRVNIVIPEDASEELKDFVEGNINQDPNWFIGVLEKMAKGLIKY